MKQLPYSVAWQDLKDLFKKYGPVSRADILKNDDGRSKGCGTIVFESADDARYAIGILFNSFFQILTLNRKIGWF